MSFGYDIYNRMISAPSSVSFAYDPAGRLYQISAAAATRFLYDGAELIAEYDTSGNVLRRYVHGLSGPMVWYEGAGTSSHRWLIPDERGSIIARDNAGSVSINTYDEYGQGGGANGGRFQYVGLPWIAEAGVYQMGARAYSPSIGRWMQTDPILTAGGVNLYAYVGNDPVNSSDLLGLYRQNCPGSTGSLLCGGNPGNTIVCSGNCGDLSNGGGGTPADQGKSSTEPEEPPVIVTGRIRPRSRIIVAPIFNLSNSYFTLIQQRQDDPLVTGDPYQDQPDLENCPKSLGRYDPTKFPQNLPRGFHPVDIGGGRTNVYMRGPGGLYPTPDYYYQAFTRYQAFTGSANGVSNSLTGWGYATAWDPPIGATLGAMGAAAGLMGSGPAPVPPPGCG